MEKIYYIFILVLTTISALSYWLNDDREHCYELLTATTIKNNNQLSCKGCITAVHSPGMVSNCITNQTVVFVGDSTSRQIYNEIVHSLGFIDPHEELKHADKNSIDEDRGLSIHFKWDPYLNATDFSLLDNDTFLVLGTGLWYLRYANIQSWSQTMDKLFDMELPENTLLMPVLHPEMDKLSAERAETITDEDVDAMNNDLQVRWTTSPSNNTINIPFSINEIMSASPNETTDGLHYSRKVIQQTTQLLYNYWCNDIVPSNNVTCCRPYPTPRPLQLAFIFAAIVGSFSKLILSVAFNKHPKYSAYSKHVDNVAIFSASLLFAYVADRSHFFAKSTKDFSSTMVLLLFSVIGAIGWYSWKRNDDDTTKTIGVLNRPQTDEMKGWMQLMILIYHYYGGSKIPQFYIPIRILVASYLVLLGYGNGRYFLNNRPTLSRYICTMTRYNLLTLALCWILNGSYINYYFVPIISIWFTLIWLTFSINAEVNSNLKLLIIKLAISLIIAISLLNIPQLSAIIPFEYKFRLNLDILAPFFGVLVSIVANEQVEFVNKITTLISGATLLSLALFVGVITPIKFSYNQYHPFISPFFVISLIILRNSSEWLRKHHSVYLAQIGRCSLELFVLQFHLLLAGDSKGSLLILANASKSLNLIITLSIFIPLSFKINQVTNYLVDLLNTYITPTSVLPLTKSPNPIVQISKQSNYRLYFKISIVITSIMFVNFFY
ncbi:Cas1p-domain-containing protein [Wallemia mellicola]|nr:Cas1p-domain-containing protein [Wallemia mellicola]TIB87522.1 Cas1p-domain-containing protein [Wallemia mellicola]TIC40000.1 Cas1p-domain-containing protein [Wallemia mellicola]TIC48354.1 Cas1p-domain-containing protein [Wallemia mellicola]